MRTLEQIPGKPHPQYVDLNIPVSKSQVVLSFFHPSSQQYHSCIGPAIKDNLDTRLGQCADSHVAGIKRSTKQAYLHIFLLDFTFLRHQRPQRKANSPSHRRTFFGAERILWSDLESARLPQMSP